jgi:large subunit ribosomal protein L21
MCWRKGSLRDGNAPLVAAVVLGLLSVAEGHRIQRSSSGDAFNPGFSKQTRRSLQVGPARKPSMAEAKAVEAPEPKYSMGRFQAMSSAEQEAAVQKAVEAFKEKGFNTTSPVGKYAIVEASGKQFWVSEGMYYDFDRIPVEPGSKLTLDTVLFVRDEIPTIGTPYVDTWKIDATVMSHLRGKKLRIVKYRPKKKYKRTIGFRPDYTRIRIDSIRKV